MRRERGAFLPAALALLTLAAAGSPRPLAAQYFGRNKVHYKTLDFRVMRSPHFDIYYYPAESAATVDAARMAERWYSRLAAGVRDTFERKPIVLYATAPDFQQTNVISGFLGQGTGGVTEPARSRATLFFSPSYSETDHVLGHELVHVFQFDISEKPQGGGLRGMSRLPLWTVEGMAEYLTLGRDDPNTAMWMRDAALYDDLPTIKQLSSGRYFPYRYGEALWAYVAGQWGDDTVPALFRTELKQGLDGGVRRVLGISTDSLSKQWQAATRSAYLPAMRGRTRPDSLGASFLPPNGGTSDMDVGPALSPDGRHVAFVTQRGLLETDLYVADAATGRILKRLTSPNTDAHFDALNFINSAGSWSPDGERLAYTVYAGGTIEVAIFNVARGGVERRVRIPGVDAVNDVAWGPDEQIALSAMSGGSSDLFLYDLSTGQVQRLTSDRYAQLQPAWSPDGRSLAFVTDSGPGTDFDRLSHGPMRIAIMDLDTRTTRLVPLFAKGKHINPQFAPDGDGLYFIADPDGFADIYRTSLSTGEIHRVTQVATGVSGITALSPALSVAHATGRLMFSVFARGGFTLRRLEASDVQGQEILVTDWPQGSQLGGILPPDVSGGGRTTTHITDWHLGLLPPQDFQTSTYHPSFGLDYLGTQGVGVAFGPGGNGLSGGVGASFSDNLGNHVIAAELNVAGEVEDIGGQVSYFNQAHRWNWGVAISHVPSRSLAAAGTDTTVTTSSGASVPAVIVTEGTLRTFAEQASVFAQYPLSATRRLEFNAGGTHIGYSLTLDRSIATAGRTVASESHKGSTPPGLNFGQVGAAYVGDYSSFGATSPIAGGRYRFGADPTFGSVQILTTQLDYRRYFFANPVTFAVRGYHYGRYGPDADNAGLSPLYLGDPLLVRGYDANSFKPSECVSAASGAVGSCPAVDRLLGSKLAVINAELRIPVLGTRQLGLINFPYVPLELSPFIDAGVAWTDGHGPHLEFSTTSAARIPVFSSGLSARVNVLGYAVVEVFYAYAFQRPGHQNQIGIQIAPGW